MRNRIAQHVQQLAVFFTARRLFVVVLLVALFFGLLTETVFAQGIVDQLIDDPIGLLQDAIAWMFNLVIFVIGAIITSLLVPVLVGVASYNDFMTNTVVSTGWALTRDLANMFFIVVLLIIAFATMLRIQTYHYKQMLGKLIIMIVLINFSKLISGVLIDFFQVIMLTFVNGFKAALGGNFIYAFRIYDMLALSAGTGPGGTGTLSADTITEFAILGGLALAAVGLVIVATTITIMIVILLYRIVMLWILVVLSPLAYFAYTIRPNYWSQWWGEFFKHLTTGPVVAFFLWLSLLTAQRTPNLIEVTDAGGTSVLGTSFAQPDVFINYITMIVLMIAGLVVSQKMANQSGAAVGNIAGKIRSVGTKAAVAATGLGVARWGAKKVGKGTLDRISQSDFVKNQMVKLGTGTGTPAKLLGLIPGVKGVARKGAVALDRRNEDLKAQAKSFLGVTDDPKLIGKIAKKKPGLTKGGEMKRIIKQAQSVRPSAAPKMMSKLGQMSNADLASLTTTEWQKIGERAILDDQHNDRASAARALQSTGVVGDFLSRNASARGAANQGIGSRKGSKEEIDAAEMKTLTAELREGVPDGVHSIQDWAISDMRGNFRNSPPSVDRWDGRAGNFRMVPDEDKDKSPGSGELSPGQVGAGSTNVIPLNFEDANLEYTKPKDAAFSDVKGYHVSNEKEFEATRARLIEMIQAKLEAGTNVDGTELSDTQREKMEAARDRLAQDPESFVSGTNEDGSKRYDLSLVNSAAPGYKLQDAITTHTHERFHGQGFDNEEDVAKMEEFAKRHKLRTQASVEHIGSTVQEGVRQGKSVDAVLSEIESSEWMQEKQARRQAYRGADREPQTYMDTVGAMQRIEGIDPSAVQQAYTDSLQSGTTGDQGVQALLAMVNEELRENETQILEALEAGDAGAQSTLSSARSNLERLQSNLTGEQRRRQQLGDDAAVADLTDVFREMASGDFQQGLPQESVRKGGRRVSQDTYNVDEIISQSTDGGEVGLASVTKARAAVQDRIKQTDLDLEMAENNLNSQQSSGGDTTQAQARVERLQADKTRYGQMDTTLATEQERREKQLGVAPQVKGGSTQVALEEPTITVEAPEFSMAAGQIAKLGTMRGETTGGRGRRRASENLDSGALALTSLQGGKAGIAALEKLETGLQNKINDAQFSAQQARSSNNQASYTASKQNIAQLQGLLQSVQGRKYGLQEQDLQLEIKQQEESAQRSQGLSNQPGVIEARGKVQSLQKNLKNVQDKKAALQDVPETSDFARALGDLQDNKTLGVNERAMPKIQQDIKVALQSDTAGMRAIDTLVNKIDTAISENEGDIVTIENKYGKGSDQAKEQVEHSTQKIEQLKQAKTALQAERGRKAEVVRTKAAAATAAKEAKVAEVKTRPQAAPRPQAIPQPVEVSQKAAQAVDAVKEAGASGDFQALGGHLETLRGEIASMRAELGGHLQNQITILSELLNAAEQNDNSVLQQALRVNIAAQTNQLGSLIKKSSKGSGIIESAFQGGGPRPIT